MKHSIQSKRYKVVHVTTELSKYCIGGIGTVLDSLYENRNQDELFVFVHPDGMQKNFYEFDDDVIVMSISEFLDIHNPLPFEADTVYVHNYNLFEMHRFDKSTKLIYVIHSLIPVEMTFVNTYGDREEKNFWKAVNIADELVVVSNSEKSTLEKIMGNVGYSPKKITVIYNGVSQQEIIKKDYNMKNGVIGYIGRLDYRKGVFQSVKEWKDIEDFKLILACGGVGSFPPYYSNKLSNTIESYAKNKVFPIGLVSNERKKDFFRKVDALIVPSLYEPFGMTVVEGIVNGLPILATRYGGVKEILGKDYPLYFDPCKKGDLKRVIALYKSMSSIEIRKLVERNIERVSLFSEEIMISKYRGET
ncbi:glycosyltransferase family 4 protein [Marinicrinis sediminis]|uniref:Glycosyltransferase family 4 protein n=1 Tax=Marinicrinis sediminis TaxID=1652465 RepID=A0ABW5RCL1_9BACL